MDMDSRRRQAMDPTPTPTPAPPTVVVIGGSSGIGLGISREMLRAGAQVVIVARSPERLDMAATELGHPMQLSTATADITDEDQVSRLFAQLDGIDHLI